MSTWDFGSFRMDVGSLTAEPLLKRLEKEGGLAGLRSEGVSGVVGSSDPAFNAVALARFGLNFVLAKSADALPRARARRRMARRFQFGGSLLGLVSNVAVLGALGIGNATASVCAAVVALLVSSAKVFEDHLVPCVVDSAG